MLEQYAFTRPAFADDRGDLALIYFQVDLIENRLAAESFGHIFEFDYGRIFHDFRSPSEMCLDLLHILAKMMPVIKNIIEIIALHYHLISLDIFTATFERGEKGGDTVKP
jgi:hypothetical protein